MSKAPRDVPYVSCFVQISKNICIPVIFVALGEISAVTDAAEASVVRNLRHPLDNVENLI